MADTDKIYNSIAAEKARAQYVKNLMGAADGIATLDSSGLVPSDQLPSYIDDIVELVNITDTAPSTCSKGDWYFNTTTSKLYKATAANTWGVTAYSPEKAKIYFNKTNEKSYRWGGSAMVEASNSDFIGIKVGSGGSTLTPSQGVIEIPAYEAGAQVNPGVMGASGSSHASGLVPDTPTTAGTSKYLREDGTWAEPAGFTDTTYQLTVNGTAAGDTTSGTNLGSVYAPTSAGTEGQMLIANASGIPTWGSKPAYTLAEVGASMSVVAISVDTSSVCGITGAGNSGKTETIIYTNSGSSDLTVTVPTTNIQTPDGEPIELTCHGGGYCEVNYINISGVIYARGI